MIARVDSTSVIARANARRSPAAHGVGEVDRLRHAISVMPTRSCHLGHE